MLNFTWFCLSRPHYPFECSREEIDLFNLNMHGITIHREDQTDNFDLHIKPRLPVSFIYLPITPKPKVPV